MALRKWLRKGLHDPENTGTVTPAEQTEAPRGPTQEMQMSDVTTDLPVDDQGFTDPGPSGYADPVGTDTPAPADEPGPFDPEVPAEPGTSPEPTDAPDEGVSTEAPEVTDGTDAAGSGTEDETVAKVRRPRGWLANDVKVICDKFITGEIALEDGQALTPHRVARLVKEHDGLDEAPSTGAVAAVFKRWGDFGFATFSDKPFAFLDYTEEGRSVGLQGMIQARSDARKNERAAAKAAEAPTEAPAE